ncbi:MAG: DUF1501 domain-containing protein [Fimbriimonadaceae bacterium]|nr:DUF1501 domain-containing protein [Fimbriimonadaceae bacterium]QYK54911.1 MAG: DUF1501 domain-containing protein [Fimbriimonadaceae bacterium]
MSQGCQDYHLTRRQVIGGATAATVASMLGVSWLPQVAYAQSGPTRDVIISVFLRGGVDGLSMIVPYADPNYYVLRPNIGVPRPDANTNRKAVDLDSFFGLHPALGVLLPAYMASDLLFIHAIGAANWSRSHFDAQRWMEVGSPNDFTSMTGWLGRHLATTAPVKSSSPLRGVSLTYGLQRTMNGAPKTLPIRDPGNFDFGGNFSNEAEMSLWVGRQYNRVNDATTAAVTNTRSTIAMLDRINFSGYRPAGGAVYNSDGFANSLKATAALLKADAGVEAVHIDLDGFDTHSEQGVVNGYYDQLMRVLGNGLSAFYTDMKASNKMRWTLVVLSEFGRTARENGARGTDHGTGNCMMVLGGGVNGKRVLRQWPGLRRDQLYQNVDLAATIDYRDVLAEILYKRAANRTLSTVFPGYTPQFRNVVKAAA